MKALHIASPITEEEAETHSESTILPTAECLPSASESILLLAEHHDFFSRSPPVCTHQEVHPLL
jgi:hypothetical protein